MTTLSPAQVYQLARGAGLAPDKAVVATAIAGAESGYRTDAVGDVGLQDATWGPSVGLWQIRSLKAQQGTGQVRDASRLTDPTFNAQAMASISGQGGNFGAWSTFKSGAFQKFMGPAAGAANNDFGPIGSLVGGAASAVGGAVAAVTAPFSASSWQGLAFKIVGGLTAAALVVAGAVHTVSQ